MSRKMIPVEEALSEWRKDPKYVAAYNALDDEFSLAKAMIEARAHAGPTQEQLADANTNRRMLVFKAGTGSQWFPWRDATKLVWAALAAASSNHQQSLGQQLRFTRE